jgi:hypothetical protein
VHDPDISYKTKALAMNGFDEFLRRATVTNYLAR